MGKEVKASSRPNSTRVLAESLVMIALSAGLYMFKVFTFPQGGSVTLGSMIPIFVLAFRRGVKVGMVAGACLGLIVVVIEPFAYYPLQFILDYPLAFAVLGVAGFFRRWPILGVGAGIGARFLCHFISGSLYFCSYMSSGFTSCPVYSAFYNASYLVPEFLISAVIVFFLAKRNILSVSA